MARYPHWRTVLYTIGLVLAITACMSDNNTTNTTVTVLGPLVREKADRFEACMQPFEERTGIDVVYEGRSDAETQLATRLENGNPPDIAGFTQPRSLARFADDALDVTTLVSDTGFFAQQYEPHWLRMATVVNSGSKNDDSNDTRNDSKNSGKIVGIWHRVTLKSLVWYPPVPFQEAGYEVPQRWDELIALSNQMVADGQTPWAAPMESAAATGWVGTDWVEDILLRTTTLETYDKWTRGELPFNSPEVRRAFELMGTILNNEQYVYGGTIRILANSFFDSGEPLLASPPDAYMVKQESLLSTWQAPMPSIGPKADLNVFPFPPIDPTSGRPALVAGDVYAVFNDRPEVRQVAAYLATAESVKTWVEWGGSLSPHKDITHEWYKPGDRAIAEILYQADHVRFDGSALMPPSPAGRFLTGVVEYLSGGDLDQILKDIDKGWPHPPTNE